MEHLGADLCCVGFKGRLPFAILSTVNVYSSLTVTWFMTNGFQVEFFSFNHRKQWKLSVCKKVINQVRVNEL